MPPLVLSTHSVVRTTQHTHSRFRKYNTPKCVVKPQNTSKPELYGLCFIINWSYTPADVSVRQENFAVLSFPRLRPGSV